MCDKIPLFNFHFKVLRKISENFNEYILRNRFLTVPLLFRSHVCLSNLKHAPSRELPLTATKTVFSHLRLEAKKCSQTFEFLIAFPDLLDWLALLTYVG